ncbi:hypothetical protein H4S01_002235, partial [Coemansia sp. RSA 2610]
LSEKLVSDVMTDLDHVFMVDIDARLDRVLLTEMVRRGHGRVPVYEGHRKNIVGVLLVKSLVLLDPDDAVPVREAKIASIPLITPDVSLYDILNAFQEGGSHLAAVMGPQRPAAGKRDAQLSVASNCSSSSTLASAVDAGAPLLSSPGHAPCYLAINTTPSRIPGSFAPIGIITLEDVIEELIQEEIIDETDEFIDICRRVKVLGVKERDESQDDEGAVRRGHWVSQAVGSFLDVSRSTQGTPVAALAAPESYLNVARMFGEFMDNDEAGSAHQQFLESLIVRLHEEANANVAGPPPASREFIRTLPAVPISQCKGNV